MKNIQDLLKQKEAELERVQREIEALRIVARLLDDGTQTASVSVMPVVASAGTPLAAVSRMQKGNGHATSDVSTRQFP